MATTVELSDDIDLGSQSRGTEPISDDELGRWIAGLETAAVQHDSPPRHIVWVSPIVVRPVPHSTRSPEGEFSAYPTKSAIHRFVCGNNGTWAPPADSEGFLGAGEPTLRSIGAWDAFGEDLPEVNRVYESRCLGGGDRNAFIKMLGELESLADLEPGWDSYSASPPGQRAIQNARDFLQLAQAMSRLPDSIQPSVVGGVGATYANGAKLGYVEFLNSGLVHCLISDANAEPVVKAVAPRPHSYLQLLAEIRAIVDA